MAKWISVRDKLPEKYLNVLAAIKGAGVCVGHFDIYDRFILDEQIVADELVTHWQPFPVPPTYDEYDEYED